MITDMEFSLGRRYNNSLKALNADAQAIIDRKEDEILRQRDQLAALQKELALYKAHAAGLMAEVVAMKKAHPTSPELKTTGKRMPDGRPQTQLLVKYANAFDKEAIAAGLTNPELLREVAK